MSKKYSFADLLKAKEGENKKPQPTEPAPVVDLKADQPDQIEIKDQLRGYLDIQNPDIQISKMDSQISTVDIQTGYPDIQNNEPHLDIQISRYPDRQSDLDIQISKLPKPQPSRANRTPTLIRLPNNKLEQYKEWCFKNKINFQDLVERAIDSYLGYPDIQTNQPRGYPESQISGYPIHDHDHDDQDLIDDKLSSIMRSYSELTGNKFTSKDQVAYREIAHLDASIITVGIKLSVVRARDRVGSLRYCIGAINEVALANIGDLKKYSGRLDNELLKKKRS